MAEQSKQFEMTKLDWKKRFKSAVVYFAPILLAYIGAVLGSYQLNGSHFTVKSFIPSQMIIDGTIFWGLMQVQGTIMTWVDGK